MFDWIEEITFQDLLDSAGSLALYGDLVQGFSPRFDPETALIPGGVFDVFGSAIQRTVDRDEVPFLLALNKTETASELSAWLRRVLPVPEELAKFESSRASALRALRHVLKSSNSGQALGVRLTTW